MTTDGVWRKPAQCTTDYPGLEVQDNRVSGSINIGPTRLPLWAIITDWVLSGWEATADNYGVPGSFTEQDMSNFLYELLEQRGEFGRLVCILADVERQERLRDEYPFKAWWRIPASRGRVIDQLRRCLNALEQLETISTEHSDAEA